MLTIWEGDEWKTALSTCIGRYEYNVMPFGLAISPCVCQSFINNVFWDMLDHWVIICIDDILVYSNTYEEHVRSVLHRLIDQKLYAKEMWISPDLYISGLRHQSGGNDDGLEGQSCFWLDTRATLKEIQCFLRFAHFYRCFIRNFSSIASPLTFMTKRKKHVSHGLPRH